MTKQEAKIKYNALYWKYRKRALISKGYIGFLLNNTFANYYWDTYCYWRDKE